MENAFRGPRHKYECNLKMDAREAGSHKRPKAGFVNMVANLQVEQKLGGS
jgi:hypothetical protein